MGYAISQHPFEFWRSFFVTSISNKRTHSWLFVGFPFAFGVFQSYYSSHEPFAGQPNIAAIGTSAMGVMYLTSPIMMGPCQKLGRWARWTPLLGLIIMALALSLSSFSTTTTHMIVSQGVFYGVGSGIAYYPCIVVSIFRGVYHPIYSRSSQILTAGICPFYPPGRAESHTLRKPRDFGDWYNVVGDWHSACCSPSSFTVTS